VTLVIGRFSLDNFLIVAITLIPYKAVRIKSLLHSDGSQFCSRSCYFPVDSMNTIR